MDVETERHLAAIANEFNHMWPRPGFVRRSEEFARFPFTRAAVNKVVHGELLDGVDRYGALADVLSTMLDGDPYYEPLLHTYESVLEIDKHLRAMDREQVEPAILQHLSGYTPPKHRGPGHGFSPSD